MGEEILRRFNFRHENPVTVIPFADARNEAINYIELKKDKEGCEVKYVDDVIGKGVFATKIYDEGEFILEYDGQLVMGKEGERRQKCYPDSLGSHIFFFTSTNGKKFCIDGTFSKRQCRFANDAAKGDTEQNADMKKLFHDNRPHLALFASRLINVGEEIRYDYGVNNLPWRRKKVPEVSNRPAANVDKVCLPDCSVILKKLTLEEIKDWCSEDRTGFSKSVSFIQTDQLLASFLTKKIWAQSQATDYIVARVYGYNVTDEDIMSLKGTRWLTDQVVDAYLSMLCQAEKDKGRQVLFIPSQAMTSICNGQAVYKSSKLLSKVVLSDFELLLGAYLQANSHWILVVLTPGDGSFYYLNPLGSRKDETDIVLKFWRQYTKYRCIRNTQEKDIQWKRCEVDYACQQDGYNCGVYTLMYAEKFLSHLPLADVNIAEINEYRSKIAKTLLLYEVDLKDCCPCCGFQVAPVSMIQCIACKKAFHKMSFCVGEVNIGHEMQSILCKMCNQNMMVFDNLPTAGKQEEAKKSSTNCTEIDPSTNNRDDEDLSDWKDLKNEQTRLKPEKQFVYHSSKCIQNTSTHLSNSELSDSNEDALPNEDDAEQNQEFSCGSLDNEKRRNSKRPCPFCGKFQSRLTRHLKAMHREREEVKMAVVLPTKERNQAFKLLKRKGYGNYNKEKMKNPDFDSSALIRDRNRGGKNLVICSHCQGSFSRKYMYRHKRDCTGSEGITPLPMALPPSLLRRENELQEFVEDILPRFSNDEAGNICRNDAFIRRYGNHQFKRIVARKDKKTEGRKSIMSEMRRLANLFIYFRNVAEKNDKIVTTSLEIFKSDNFKELEEAIRIYTTNDESGKLKHGLKNGIGYLLLRAVKKLKGMMLVDGKTKEVQDTDEFLGILKYNWPDIFADSEYHCLKAGQEHNRRPKNLPDEKDIAKLRNFTLKELKRLTTDEYTFFSGHEFIMLRDLVASRLTFFNGRRGGEPSRLLISEWIDAEDGVWVDKKSPKTSDPLEQLLLMKHKLAYQAGKNVKHLVPIIIPEDCWEPLRKLADPNIRMACGVSAKNNYLFPFTRNSDDHVQGWTAADNACTLASVDKRITATDMRHRASTIYAALDIPESERETFYRHMGHSENINRDVYQCPLSVKEITQCGKFFVELDNLDSKKKEEMTFNMESLQKIYSLDNTEDSDYGQELQQPSQCSEGLKTKTCLKKRTKRSKRKANDSSDETWEDNESSRSSTKDVVKCLKTKTCLKKRTKRSKRKANDSSDETWEDNESSRSSTKDVVKYREYYQWDQNDAKLVRIFFKDFVNDTSTLRAKGALPGQKLCKEFFQTYPHVLSDFPSEEKKIYKLRSKVFTERGITRKRFRRRQEELVS